MSVLHRCVAGFVLSVLMVCLPLAVMAEVPRMGIVIMHGKGGSPARHVGELAQALEEKGYLVANLEMPWSGRRDYDVAVDAAELQVKAALAELRGKGAQKVFVAGHSQGGAFALHFAGVEAVDGVICIAPGGNVGSSVFRDKLGDSVARARQLVAEGKGGDKVRFDDYEGKKGLYPIVVAPEIYLSWFDPDGAMNTTRAARAAMPQTPVLWLVAQRDYPGLRKSNIPLFKALPPNAMTRLHEPDSDHAAAPSASLDEIVRWTGEIGGMVH